MADNCYIVYKGKNYTQEDFLEYLKSLLPVSQSTKQGVDEVFKENPELANSIYESLGFKQNTEAKKTGLLDYFLNVKKDSIFQELIQIAENLGIGIEEYESDSPLQANWNGKNITINKTYGKPTSNVIAHEVVHGILHTLTNNDYANSKLNLKLEKFKIELFDYIEKKGINNLNLPPELRILKLDYIKKMSNQEIVTYAFTDSQFSEFLASIKTDAKISSRESFWSKLINIFNAALKELGFTSKLDELIDILNTEVPLFDNNQITPQQKQQAQQQYSQYLETIIPGGELAYHGTDNENLKDVGFDINKNTRFNSGLGTNFFLESGKTGQYGKERVSILYNPKNLLEFSPQGGTDKIEFSDEQVQKIMEYHNLVGKVSFKDYAEEIREKIYLHSFISSIVNKEGSNEKAAKVLISLGIDGTKGDLLKVPVISINNPDAMHILGSKKDVKGFKNFIGNLKQENKSIKLPSSYKGIPIIEGPIQTSKNTPVAARYRKFEGVIYADLIQIEQKFKDKAWTNPALQKDGSYTTALPENQFNNITDFTKFILEHEFAHSHIFKQEGETTGQYEDRINQEALKQTFQEDNISNLDTYQYYGKIYQIHTVDGVGVKVEGYMGSNVKQQALLAAYNNNKDIDPQTGRKFRNLSPLEELEQKITGNGIGTSNTLNSSKYELFPGVYANEGQKRAIDSIEEFFAGDKDQFLLKGRGGTGKTTIVKKTLEQFDKSRVKILGSTISYEAKNVLQDNMQGYKTATLASVLGLIPDYAKDGSMFFREKTLEERMNNSGLITPLPIETVDILIVDEASMIDEFIYNKLLELKKPRTKILFMGDNVQIPPINSRTDEEGNVIEGENSDSPVWQLIDSGDYVELSERMRQGAESPILPITDLYAKNVEEIQSGETGLKNPLTDRTSNFQNNEGVLFTSDVNEVVNQFVEDIEGSTDIREAVIVGARNAVVDDMNLRVRKKLFETEEPFVIGDSIRINSPHVENNEVIFENGLRAKVKDVYELPEDNLGLKRYELEIEYIETNEKGDKFIRKAFLKTISPQDQKQYKNKLKEMAARAKSFVPKTPESKKAWKEFFDIKSSTVDVGYGYAITSHKVQGSTYNSAYVLEGDIMSFPGGIEQTNRMMYTAVSRPRKKLVIFNPSVVESQQVSQPKIDIRAKVYELFNLQGYMDIKTSHKTDKNLITAISHYVLEDLGYKTDQEKLQAVREGFKLSEYITTEQISDVHTRVRLNMKNIIEDEVDDGPVSLGGIKFTSSGYESNAKNAFTCK